nr:restriction endonuclease subunit S [Micrococcus luteus]
MPLKSMADIVLGKMLQPQDLRKGDIEVPYLRSASLQDGNVLDLAGAKTMWASPKEKETMNLRAGDVVVSEGGSVGRAVVLHEDLPGFIFQNSVNRVRPVNGSDGRYLAYVLTTIRHSGYFSVYCDAVSIAHLTAEKLGRLRIPAATADIQRRIADYLDRETATIDALIEKQRELVRHLEERRVAFRERLVDEVCAHAAPIAYRRVVTGIRQGWSPQCNNWPAPANVWRVLKVGCVNHGVFRSNENKELPGNLAPRPETVVRAGELVVSRANTRELVGSAAAVPEEHPRLMLSDKLYAISHSARANSEFMALVLGTARYRELIELEATGASPSMQNISQDVLLSLPVRLPEVRVQEETVERWDRETATIDALIAKAERFIELAQERRAALITAAVTGQIEIPTED